VRTLSLRRVVPALIVLLVAGIGLALLVSTSKSNVTRARLERSLPQTFANLYVQQAKILGHKGITVRSLHAQTQCDKGGPNVADRGPGPNWICLMTWHDPNIDETLMPGKFEVNVHSNDCYTAGGPSKLVGLFTITDTRGNDVSNPVFEWDACFNPDSSNRPTGVTIQTTSPATTTTAPQTATLALPAGPIKIVHGSIAPLLTCSPGSGGCAGTVTFKLGATTLGAARYIIRPGQTQTLAFRVGSRSKGTLAVTAEPIIGSAPAGVTRLRLEP
jgi:hypothetical protein